MPEQRRKSSPQFKAEAVQLVIESGKPIAESARGLGVNDGTFGNWVKAWRDANPEPETELSPVERARMKELEEENPRSSTPTAAAVHLDRVRRILPQATCAPQRRAHWRVLGQRRRRSVLRRPENDLYHRYRWPTRARAGFAVAEYIEVFYNRRRRHSTVGYRPPRKPSSTTIEQQPLLDQQAEKLSKILDAAHPHPGRLSGVGGVGPAIRQSDDRQSPIVNRRFEARVQPNALVMLRVERDDAAAPSTSRRSILVRGRHAHPRVDHTNRMAVLPDGPRVVKEELDGERP